MFHVEKVHLRFGNGEERLFERFTNKNRQAVMILPILNDDTLLLIREYGVGIEDYHLSFPKGGVEPGESIVESANRELKEEVGYGAKTLTPLATMSSSPSYSRAVMEVLVAESLYPCSCPGDEPEPIEVVPWPLKKIDELISREEFHEARAVAALLMYARQRGL
tara:strand:+ start:465 stop:956 length:492 start_codon:yes stop_codon:yes gene_type:complete